MKIGILAIFVGATAFGVGTWACFVQADNFEEGARLQGLQVEVEWYERRISGLRSEISRFEFEAQTEDNQADNLGRKEPAAVAGGRGVQ